MTETTLTDLVETRPAAASDLREASTRLRPSTARLVAEGGRAGLVWLAVAVVYGGQGPLTESTLAPITLAASIWLVTSKAASSPDVLLFGRIVSDGLGVGLGFVAVVALNGSPIGLHLDWAWLAGTAFGVMATVSVWGWFVDLTPAARRRVLFLGADDLDLMHADAQCRRAGFEIVGPPDPSAHGSSVGLAGMDELERVVAAHSPDIVVLTDESTFADALDRLLPAYENVRVASVAGFCEYAFGRVPVDQITPAWFMSLVHPRQRVYTRFSKRAFDIAVSLAGMVVAAPLLAALALVSKLTPGPVFYRQVRLGEDGRLFTILKFRTMACDAEQAGPAFSGQVDARVRGIASVVRRTHLDELPQLWNVLKGEMSIVGPRPERPEFIDMLESAVPFWSRRLLVKPGITGWAQVQCGYKSDCDGMAEKLSYDLWYLRHRSVLVDLAVCLLTFGHVVRRCGRPEHARRDSVAG